MVAGLSSCVQKKESSDFAIVEAGGFAFKLEMEIKREEEEKSAGLYLRASLMKDSHLIDADVTVCLYICRHAWRRRIAKASKWNIHMNSTKAKQAPKALDIRILCHQQQGQRLLSAKSHSLRMFTFSSIEVEESSEESPSLSSTLLCARLADLQDEFTTNINTLYSNSYFFSQGFRKSLARELQGSRGGIGLPGNIASHVPVGVLRKLRSKLPTPIAEYRNKVLVECTTTSQAVIESFVGIEQHPKLQSVLVDGVNEIFTAPGC